MADNDNRYKLWQTISKEYDLPDYNQFSKDMEDATKRKSLHDAVSAEYDLPDFDQFSKDMGYETQTTQQGNQNAQNAKKPQQTAQSSHVEEGRGLPSDNGYSKQKTAFNKAAEQAWNKLAHKGGIKWTIEGHPEVKMVAVTDDLVKKFPQLEQSRGYQVPFNMSTGTPIMQNIDDKGNIITPDEASEQYTKILTNQDFDYVPKQETASVQVGSVVNTALSTKGGWLDRMARKSMAQYGDDWEHQKFESDGKEVSSSDVFGKVKQTIYDYYNSVLKGIRTHLMFNSDEEKQAYVDNLYKTGQLKEEDIPKANVLHYVQNVDKEEQIEAVRQAKLNRQLELEIAQEKFNQLPQREKGESDFDYNDRILHEGALYEQDIRKLKKQIAQLDAVSDELQGNNTSWKEWGHAFKTSGIGSYHAWDLGATDLKDAIELNKVANGMKRGMQMTSSDYMALMVMSQANEADAIENAVMPVSYKSKKGSFISAPFTFGFFVGGDIAKGLTSAVNKVAGKVISKAVKGAVLKAGGKKALSAATNLAEKAANTKCVKLFGMLAKDVEKAAFMENTTGAATTGAEILNRHIGTVTESDDGFKMEGESLPTAIIKGEISQNIESQTEFLGEHFPSSLKFIRGMAHTKVGSAMGLRNLAAWLTKVSRTEFATTLKSYATRAGINGVFGEYLEEVAGTAENALLVGDQKFSDLFDVKQQEEVAGSVVLSCLGMGIFGTAIYTGQRGLNMPTYYRFKHLQNKWDNAGLDLFTGEEWAKLKDRIDNTPNEGMKFVMADILKADNMTEEQARAAFNYARCSLTLRGMNLGAMKAAQLGLTDDRHIEQDNAYVEGRQAEDEDKHDIQIEFEDRSHELAEKLGISEQQLDNMSDEDLESLTGKDDQLDNLIYDYQTSHAKYQGVVDNADDEIDKAAQEAARQTDMATDKSRGTVRNATIKATKGEEDYSVYIVSGNVATNEDGSINVSESDDMILYYDPKSGKIEHCDAMRLAALGEEVNAEETRNQAIADAKEKAIRKQAGIIDGTVGEGTSFIITDAEGNEHTYEVLADNGDGSAMITMDGNVQDNPVSLQDLQNLKDAEEAKRLEAVKMQRQQYEEEREKQNTPVEDNLDYTDIINTNGNVEIAEVVDDEGNAMFPDAEEVFFVQNQGDRAKVMVLDNEGNLQPKLVKKSSVRSLGTMSVDEYRQGRQQALKEAENASEPSLVDETEPSNNVVTDNTTTDESQSGNEAEVTTSDETQNISNEQENTPKITLEDGTEVPMLEDGNPDFSQLTAEQVAELYDSQFGDDAEQIVSGNVNKAKKALDKANGMTVSGGSFAEQKASKKAKDKAIAEAKEKYDSAKAIADAYNERMLAKEEDTPEGRMNLIEKARRKFNRMKGSVKDNAQAIAQLYDETVGALLHRLYDSTGIDVFDDTANTVDEYVASSIAPYSLNYEGTETSKGVKQETGLSRSDFAKTGFLAKEGKGKTIGQLANDLWRDRPSNLENITDQDVRNAIIDLITSGQTAFGLKNHIQNLRIAEAENVLEQQKRQADELAHAEKQKEEELASTEQADDNTEESSNTEATPADAQEEDKLADMPFEAPLPDEDAPFSAKDKTKDPLEVWNNMTDEEKTAYIENNRVKDTRLVDDVVGKKLRKAIEKVAEMMGATIQWQRTDMIRNGWFNPNTKTIYLALDSSILEGVQFVFGHEMTHDIKTKSPAMYDELKGLVKEKYGEELFEAMTNDNEKRYAGVGKTDNDRSYYEEETVADAIGKMINDLNLTHSIALKMSHPLLAKMHDVLLKIKNAFTGAPYSDNVNGIIRTIEMAYVKTANREAVNTATQEGEGGQRLSLREKPAPKKTQKVYKLMRLGEDGKLYPLFIGSGAEVELGKWYDAESPKLQDLTSLSSSDYVGTRTVTINGVDVKEKYNYGAYIVNNETGEAMSLADFKAKYSKEFAKMGKNPNKKAVNWATDNGYRWIKIEEKKQGQSRYGGEARSYYNYGINGSGGVTTFAMRPGWHAGSLPTMRQIGKGSGRNLRDDTFVWVEGEIPADIDYNEEAQKNADKDIPDHIPTDGYYLKATNANKEASQADRVGWYVAGAFKADRIMSDKETRNIIDEWNAAHPDEEKVEYDWKRESGKDFNAETMSLDGAPKFSLRLQDAINETDTEPTEAQKKSGNYKKGHVKFGGYDYTIENPKGSYRSGVDENGKEWKQKMNDTYGYIRGKFGKDGDHLDMFINDKADLDSWNGDVFVVDQVNQDGTFDEHKVMYGYDSLDEAKKAYLSNYEKGWTGLGNITPVSKADFDNWLDKSNRKLKPFADYADITSKTNMDTAPSSFEEFLEHSAVRYSIRNEKERAAAEDAYNFAQENRPDRYSRYAIVNMEKPGAVPQYLEKKTVADNWRRYYNKLKWGNYKLFDLDKPFEDNVKNLVGKFPETFRKKNDTTLSKIKELTADYNKRKEEYDAMSNSIQELLNGLIKQGRSLAEAESVIRDWGLYKEMDSKYQNLMGIRKQLNELRSGKVADGERFSLIGKKGAEALDHAEEVSIRLDNLNVARQMEGAKKDAKAIKMATGWERGADGKWRYEIADSKLNDMMNVDGKGKMVKRNKEDMLWTSGKLGEVVVAPELFKAYPKLKDVRLETDSIMNNLPSNGEYNAKTNTITIHADELKYLDSILNHEIQHVIQDLEGFAQGGDSKHIRKVLERMINENQEASDYAKDKLKEWVTLTMAADRLSDLYKQYINSDNEWLKNKAIESYWDAMNELDNNEQSTLTNDYPDGTAREIAESGYHVDEAEKELRRLAKETKESIPEGNNSALELVSKLTDALENNDDYNLYRKLGGEVEARNVQSRMGMSPEERRKTLAEETEDVARKDQIFLYGGSVSMMGSRAFNEAIDSSDNIRFSLKEEKEKIVADAKANGTYMTAPNGEKTKLNAEQWVTVRTTNFKKWFGDWENDPENASKVVDENGEPMVVWHGRSAEFNTFAKKEGVRFIMGLEDKVKAEGFFFSPKKGLAEEFASNSFRHRGGKANVIPCFLNIRKPMDLTREDYDRIYEDVTGWDYIVGMDTQDNLWGIMDEEGMADKIKEKGYDGVIFVEEVDDSYEPTKISYCALDANQIKSAENNNGDFSADNNDIRFSLKSMMEKPEGWKQANKKAIHIAEAIERDPKFSLKNLDGTLIKAGTYFSGGGLVEEGLKGIIDPVVAVEYDEKISGVYRNNFGNHIVTADVRDVDPKELVGKIDGEVEYFHASPVCKNYSLAKNNHEELELDKETAASTAEFISKVRPKVVTIENVKGYKDSEAMKTITDALDEAGYKWDADVYNAADYGGYTNRERLIVRAVRDGELPAKPEKQKRKSGWYEAVEDIMPTLTEKKNGVAPWMDERLKADGIDWRHIDKPLYVMGSGYANGTVPHAFADELLPTLRTKSGDVIVMPDGKVYRAMGRVLARVSGVSDDYQMPASEALSHTIIGNGIPTQLTENVIAPLVRDVLHPAVEERASLKDADRKQAQLDIILKTNPMLDDYHTGIRKVEDIKTLGESVEEARSEAEKYGDEEWSAYPDITNDMLQNALETGEITIYSSKPIKNGVFVTPSYTQASDYAGGGNVYEKTVPLTDVAWINTDEGQYAKVDGERYSLRVDRYRDELNQWKKDNNLPKDAERPQLPVREPNESAADFLKRVKEYRKQAALWATAPTYEDHLLVSDTAQGQFNLEMQRKAVLTRIVIQDSMLAIRKAQEAIMKEKGVDKLNPAEDAYTAENRSHGKAKNEFEEYNDEFLQPLRKAYNELMQRLGKSYDNVKVYMIAKHGLERNAYIAFKYALDEDYETNEERMNAYNNYKADMDRLNNDADFEAGRIDFAAWKQRDGFIRTKYAPSYFKFRFDENGMTKDYSGLSALFDADDYEGAAADLVKEVEDANPYYTDELWYATNDATKKILRDSYNAGMMTEDNFNFVSGMYRNYIPLRGWGDTNADQVWNYVGGGKGAFNQVVKEAKGRKSLADDPIAYIENMAESAILMNNRNWVKQHLLLLAQNHRTSLLNVSKAWYIKTKDAQGNEEWIPASPQITEGMTGKQVEAALEAFEQKMEQMQQNGEATQKREHLEISYPQTNGEEREHEVRVMKGGEEYVIYVNGDPQLAQAVNNTRARKVREGIEESRPQRFLARTGRYMAAAYTSMSPLFIPSNYMRDLTMTLASTAIREDARYNYLLRRNMLRHWNTFPMVLSYQNGTLREKVRNGSASRVEQMFYDFMMNGGETGFVTSVDVEDLKKKFKNDLKDLNRMAANPKKVGHIIMKSIETLNRAIEDSNRFMVYMTSIEYGRSIEEAVNNAKDVTLNFNRKGTGEHGWQAIRDMYLFINPAVQSLQTLGALAKHHPFKFTAVTTGWLATGLLVPMLNNLLMSFFGGDDDKDKYWQFTKWDRRNNFIMWIPFTKEFVKIPLAQEFRGFYGVGDMIASKLWGGEKAEESWGDYAWDLAGQIVDMLPLDPTGYDGNIALAITPNAARPIGELALNVDFTGKPIFKNSEYNKYDPNFTKAYVGTPDWLVRISKMVNSIDNKYPDVEQNAIDRFGDPKFNPNNPAVIDHLLSSYLGGSYTMGSQIIGVATKALNGDDIKMADMPLASKFVSNPDDRPVSKKQGEEFWDMKERHDRAANTLSKLKKKAKVDGDYSMLDIFFGSDEYRQYKEDDKKVKKYEEDRKKEKAQETGEAYRPHKTTADDVYKSHTTPKDDFEDMKMKQLYEKLNSYKIRYEAIDGISSEKGDAYYKAKKAAIDAIEEIAYDKSQIASIKKGFLSDGQNTYDADGMKDIRELRKRILDVLEKANKAMMNNRK